MANYNQVSYGSQGDDVKTLQNLLNQNGYSLDEDGVFGDNTQNAVKDYQQKNGLSVDGIVGNNTWGALTKASGGASSGVTAETPSATTETTAPTFDYKPYQPSETVAQAEALLREQLSKKPGAYTSAWQTQLDDIINRIMNREDFSYDLNDDAMYQQLKDQYVMLGQQASMDTMGQAAALTGGYGNSYAQSVGQQAYQAQLQNLNDIVPELYQMALDQYNREGQDLINQYGILGAREEQDYGRYRDQLSDYYTELSRLTEDARYKGEQDYGKWADARDFSYGQFADDRAYNYQLSQDDFAKQEAAAQLMAGAGNYDRLGDVYGLTDEEIAAIKAANTPKVTGGNGGGEGTPLKSGTSAYNTFVSEINRADTPEKLSNIIYSYQAMGYSLDSLNLIAANRIAALSPQSKPVTTTVDLTPTNPLSLIDESKVKVGVGNTVLYGLDGLFKKK